MDGGNGDGMNDKFNSVMVQRLKNFLGMLRRRCCDRDRRGGILKAEDQNEYGVVMTAISGGEIKYNNLARYLYCKLQVLYWKVKQGKALRKDLEDTDFKSGSG